MSFYPICETLGEGKNSNCIIMITQLKKIYQDNKLNEIYESQSENLNSWISTKIQILTTKKLVILYMSTLGILTSYSPNSLLLLLVEKRAT